MVKYGNCSINILCLVFEGGLCDQVSLDYGGALAHGHIRVRGYDLGRSELAIRIRGIAARNADSLDRDHSVPRVRIHENTLAGCARLDSLGSCHDVLPGLTAICGSSLGMSHFFWYNGEDAAEVD